MSLKCIAPAAAMSILLAAAPAAHAADIEPGLYLRTVYFGGNLSLDTIYFGSGNRIATNPIGGTESFDFDAAAKASPSSVGTYKIEGAKIVITWANGKVDKFDVEFDKGGLSAYNGGLVSKADAFPKEGKRLSGSFGTSAMTQNVVSAVSLTLTEDGEFSLTGLGGIRKIPGNVGIAEKTIGGTYKLYGNTLELKPAGGGAVKLTVLPFNTALNPKKAKLSDEHLIIEGTKLVREK